MNDSAGPSPPAASNSRPRNGWSVILLTLAIAVYGAAYLVWFLQTPLGRAPQLDAAENLALARQIASGTLAPEPYYRAMLYPATLAIPLKLGLHANVLPAFASLLGLLCHFLITLGVARLATRLWPGPRVAAAGLFAAALWGLNPIALYYALQALDTVPSLALAVWALVWWSRPGARQHDAWVGGVLLGLAVAARPHFLPLVFVAPLARSWLAGRWQPVKADVMAWAGALAMLLMLGGAQKWRSGEFAILPAQGPYNFYAANRPDANGRFYSQKIFFSEINSGENPARKEAEIQYAKAMDKNPPFSLKEMNAYWRREAWSSIKANPAAWLRLEFKKLYYLLNDYDQYNNQTYAWHKEETPLLRYNFLGWGILFVLAAGILAVRGRGLGTMPTDFNCPNVAGMMLVFCTYAAGVLLYYASGRFRLPLMPLLCVLAGGWLACPAWRALSRRQMILTPVVVLFAAFVTFSHFFAARDEATFIQDELLSANAAAEVGDDQLARQYAARVLRRDPARPDARRVSIISYFNFSLLTGDDDIKSWQTELEHLRGLPIHDPALALCAGAIFWKTGDHDGAVQIWQDGTRRYGKNSAPGQALAAAQALGAASATPAFTPDPQLVKLLRHKPD